MVECMDMNASIGAVTQCAAQDLFFGDAVFLGLVAFAVLGLIVFYTRIDGITALAFGLLVSFGLLAATGSAIFILSTSLFGIILLSFTALTLKKVITR